MNTKIISISEDHNTITHESGAVTEFVEQGETVGCNNCCYDVSFDGCMQFVAPCCNPYRKVDKRNGIFKLKTT